MHVLTVFDHPDPRSFSAAIARRFMDGAAEAGHSTELADLHAEGFDPRWTLEDTKRQGAAEPGTDIAMEQERIERADAICLVFPLFWWGMPAMTKGWVDRVWTWGWAYDQLDDTNRSMQRARSGVLLIPAGARSDEIEANGHLTSLETAWMEGTFGFFGFSPRRLELLCGSQGSEARRKALLDRSFEIGLTLQPPSDPTQFA